ncbi:MAG: NADP-dependent oxidoreductase [Gammaproteobacteria bacterium]|nr:NADP-dependent oxidoreductase [Gammaproteobacteria bacterium]
MQNRQIVIVSLPTDKLDASHFDMRTVPMPEPGDGEVLCRTLALTVGAGQRAGLQGSASYAAAPKSGVVMGGTAVARIDASNADGLDVGTLVTCPSGWQDYAVHKAGAVHVVEAGGDPAHNLGVYGTNGLTAYFGLFDLGEPKAGQNVVVSAAAGSVGHIVGQMAKIAGCRVVGVAGSDEKCHLLTDDLGFDTAVNYKSPDFRQEFRDACSDGIDIYFDNTGGEVLGGALRRMKPHGRIVCCGVVSQYDTGNPAPGPRGIPGLLVNNRIRMEGFLVFDYADRYGEARTKMREWVESGKLKPLQDEFHGLEEAPRAFIDMLAGGNVGTRIIRVAE